MSERKWGIWRSNKGACDACIANNGKIILIDDFNPLHPKCKCKCIPINSGSLLEYLYQDIIGYEALAVMPTAQMIEFSALLMIEMLFEQNLLSQTEKQMLTSIMTSQNQKDVLQGFQDTDNLFFLKDKLTPLLNAATDYLNGTIGKDDLISFKERVFNEIMPVIVGVSPDFLDIHNEINALYSFSEFTVENIEALESYHNELLYELSVTELQKAQTEDFFNFNLETFFSFAGNTIIALFSQGKDAESIASALMDFDNLISLQTFADSISLWYDIKVLEARVDDNLDQIAGLSTTQTAINNRITELRNQIQEEYSDDLVRNQECFANQPTYITNNRD